MTQTHIDLAKIGDFQLGRLSVRPSLRELTRDDGEREALEPRVMQVLVALTAAHGIVSRDDLIDTCWGGRVVGDDAINRVISRLRRLSQGLAADCFEIETITKIGYRLIVHSRAQAAGHEQTNAPPPASVRPLRSAAEETPVLAVLPFTNRSGLGEDGDFAESLAEDIIDAVSQGAHVRVIATSSVTRFSNSSGLDLDAMVRQLGVRYLLQGNIRRANDLLRLTIQIVEAEGGAVLWMQRFDTPPDAVPLQDEVAGEVARHVNAQIARLETERALTKPADLTPRELMHKAIVAYRQMDAAAMLHAIGEARRTLGATPDYGLAHARLGLAISDHYLFFCLDAPDVVAEVRAAIDKGLILTPDDPLTLAFSAAALTNIGRNDDALRLAERATLLRPGYEVGHFARGMALVLLDRGDDGIAAFEACFHAGCGTLHLYLGNSWIGNAHVRAGRWHEADAAFDRSLDINPSFSRSLATKAFLAQQAGHSEEAVDWMRRARDTDPSVTPELLERRFTRWYDTSPVLPELLNGLRTLWNACEAES